MRLKKVASNEEGLDEVGSVSQGVVMVAADNFPLDSQSMGYLVK